MASKKENSDKILIDAQNLTKWYGDVCAVDNVSFKVKRGEVVGFLGPNGAGKTTTMKMITCFIAPTSGRVEVAGHDTLEDSMSVRRVIGYLPEETPLYRGMSVLEFLRFAAEIREIPKDEVSKKTQEIVEVCGLKKVLGRPIGHLSKGYRQRVGLAQAMLHDPDIVILDEPWTGLDPNQITDVRRLIKELGKDKTVLLSTHILAEVEAVCDRVVIIDRGAIVADEVPGKLVQERGEVSFTLRIKDGEGVGGLKSALKEVPGVDSIQVDKDKEDTILRLTGRPGRAPVEQKILETCVSKGATLKSLRHKASSLEDVFREMTVGDRVEIGVKAS